MLFEMQIAFVADVFEPGDVLFSAAANNYIGVAVLV